MKITINIHIKNKMKITVKFVYLRNFQCFFAEKDILLNTDNGRLKSTQYRNQHFRPQATIKLVYTFSLYPSL